MIKKLFSCILLLGVIPCDAALFTFFKNPDLGSKIVLAFNFITCLVVALSFLKNLRKTHKYEKITIKYLFYFIVLIVLNAVAALSATSGDALMSRTLSLVCLCMYYLYGLYAFDSVDDLIKSINITLLVLVVTSLVLYYVDYNNATYIENATTRYFKGVALNRNSYSEISLFFIATNLYLWFKNKKHSLFYILTTALAVYTTFLTHSATSSVCILLLIALILMYNSSKRTLSFTPFVVVYFVIFVLLIILQSSEVPFLSAIMDYFGKDSTLTGRTQLWTTSLQLIAQHPIFGRGFEFEDLISAGIMTHDPHNSILYMLLSQGILGAFIFFFLLYTTIAKAKLVLKNHPLFSYMYIFILVWMIRGLTESTFGYTHYVFWEAIIIIEMLLIDAKSKPLDGDTLNEKEIQ